MKKDAKSKATVKGTRNSVIDPDGEPKKKSQKTKN